MRGGGIGFLSISGSLNATNSTISGNSVSASDSATATDVFGGGINYDSGASMALTNVTINGNSATGPSTNVHSGGIFIGGVSVSPPERPFAGRSSPATRRSFSRTAASRS